MRPPDAAIPSQSIATYHDFLSSLLNDRDRFFEEVVEGIGLRSKLRYAAVTIVGLAGFFGLVAGAYSGPAQALSAAIKLPFLFFATFAVCFPAFFVVQVLVGSRLRLLQVVVLVFGALALTSVLLAAFVYAAKQLEKPPAPAGRQDTVPRFRGLPLAPGDTARDTTNRRNRP